MNYKNKLQEYCQKKKIPLPVYISYVDNVKAHSPQWNSYVLYDERKYNGTATCASRKEAEQSAAKVAFDLITMENNTKDKDKDTDNNKDSHKLILRLGGSYRLANSDIKNKEARVEVIQNTSIRDIQEVYDLFKDEKDEQDKQDEIIIPEKNNLDINSSTNTTVDLDNNDSINHFDKKSKHYHIVIDLENMQPKLPNKKYNHISIYTFLSNFSTVDKSKYQNNTKINIIKSGNSDAADHLMTFTVGKLTATTNKDNDIFIIVSRDKSSIILFEILKNEGYETHHHTNMKDFDDFLNSIL